MTAISVPSWSSDAFTAMRLGFAFVVLGSISRLQFFRPWDRPTAPVGLARVVDLSWMSSGVVFAWLQRAVYVAAVCYAADVLTVYALAVLAIAFLLELTIRSSYGAVNHGDHIVCVVAIAMLAAVLTWNAASTFNWDLSPLIASSRAATAAWWAIEAVVAMYFTSGLTKVLSTGGGWIRVSPNLLLSVQRSAHLSRLMGGSRHAAVERSERLSSKLMNRRSLVRLVFALGLFTELLAPIGLFGEYVLLAVGLGLIALHLANAALLTIRFDAWAFVVLVFFVIPPFFR
jgi:hypothetical protein